MWSVRIATGYGLDGPGDRIPVGARFSARPDRPWGPPSLLYSGYRVFSGGKERPLRDADPSPPFCAVFKKEYSYTSTPLYGPFGLYRTSVPVQRCTLPLPIPLLPSMGRTACTEPQCLYNGALYLYLYLYSPLWAVRAIQNLSVCTRVYCTLLFTYPTSGDCKVTRISRNVNNGIV